MTYISDFLKNKYIYMHTFRSIKCDLYVHNIEHIMLFKKLPVMLSKKCFQLINIPHENLGARQIPALLALCQRVASILLSFSSFSLAFPLICWHQGVCAWSVS